MHCTNVGNEPRTQDLPPSPRAEKVLVFCKGMEVLMPGSPSVVVGSKTTKSLSTFRLVYFSSSGGWLAKCLVLTAAKFSLFSACAVT